LKGESLFGQFGATLSGLITFWTGFAFVLSFALFGFAVWAGFHMDGATEPRIMVFWLGVLLFAMIAVGLLRNLILDAHELSRAAVGLKADRAAACAPGLTGCLSSGHFLRRLWMGSGGPLPRCGIRDSS